MSDNTIIANDEIIGVLDELRRIREYESKLKKEKEYYMQLLYNLVSEHDNIITVDENGVQIDLATWKYSKDTERFLTKEFKDNNPDLYSQYVKISPGSRTLRFSND